MQEYKNIKTVPPTAFIITMLCIKRDIGLPELVYFLCKRNVEYKETIIFEFTIIMN